jgi:hypothetical protein
MVNMRVVFPFIAPSKSDFSYGISILLLVSVVHAEKEKRKTRKIPK